MFISALPHRLSSTAWVLASFVSLGLAGCAAKYDNKAGITPAQVQILWNTNGPAQTIQLSDPKAQPPIVGDDTPNPSADNPSPVPPVPDPNNPLQTPTTFGIMQSSTPLNSAILNAVADTPGNFAYTPGEGAYLAPGVQTISLVFTPKDSTAFAVTKRTVKINVTDPTSTAGQAALVPQAVQIVGGGYVDGVFFHPLQRDLRYVRTDVGGAYRWVQSPLAIKGTAPTCPGYLKGVSTPTAARGNNGEYFECGYWKPLLDNLGRTNAGDQGVESLGLDPRDPQRLYLSTGLNYSNDSNLQNHFYLSGDQGNTFTQVNAPFPINGNDSGRDAGERFAVDPNLGTTIYYGSRTAGLWKSMDRGATWNQVTTFPVTGKTAGAGVVFITFVPSSGSKDTATPVLYAGVSDYNYYAKDGSNNGSPLYSSIYQSVDAGLTWQAVPGQPTSMANSAANTSGIPANYNLTPIHGTIGPDDSLYVTYFSDEGPDQTHSGLPYSVLTTTNPTKITITNPGAGAVYQFTPTVGAPTGNGTWTNISPSSVRTSGDNGGFGGLTFDVSAPGVMMVSTMDDYGNGDAIYRSLNYGKTWMIVEQKTSGAINDVAFSFWLGFGTQQKVVATGNWPSALAIDPFDSNHAVLGTGQTLWETQNLKAADIAQQPIFSVGSYGSAQSGVKQLFGGGSIEETVVLGLSSPPTGALLLSAVGDLGTFVHATLDASPVLGADFAPLFTTGTSVDFAQNLALTIVRVGTGSNGLDTTAPSFAAASNGGLPTLCTAQTPKGVLCTQVPVPQLLATSTTQGLGQNSWRGIDTLYDAPDLQSITPTTKVSAGGGTVAIAPDATTIVWATSDFPPACTGDGGTTWTPAVNGITGAQVISDRVTPGKYYMYDSATGKLLMGIATVTPVTFQCKLTFNTQWTLPTNSQGQLTASFGGAGDIWLAINGSSTSTSNGLYHSIDSGKTLTKAGSFTQAYAVGVGAAATSTATTAYSKPAIYTVAIGAANYGFYRSIDNGATWVLVSNPAHLMGTVNQIVGDPRTFGRYYIGTGGRGIAYVDSQ